MRHEGKMYQGLLAEYDLAQNFAVVIIKTFLDVNVVVKHGVEILPRGHVLALGRGITGTLMTTNVILAGDLSGSDDNESFIWKISEVHLCCYTCILVFLLLHTLYTVPWRIFTFFLFMLGLGRWSAFYL